MENVFVASNWLINRQRHFQPRNGDNNFIKIRAYSFLINDK